MQGTEILNWALTVVVALIGYLGARLHARTDRLQADLTDLRLKVAEQHPTKAELESFRVQMRDTLTDVLAPIRTDLSEIKRKLDE